MNEYMYILRILYVCMYSMCVCVYVQNVCTVNIMYVCMYVCMYALYNDLSIILYFIFCS